jgi:hypothetical protein
MPVEIRTTPDVGPHLSRRILRTSGSTGPGTELLEEHTVNTYIDSTVRTEIDRRFELAGVDPSDRHAHHRSEVSGRPLGLHPLAALLARLVGGPASSPAGRSARSTVAAGRPRHP